jgi:hypothetical protein
VRHSAHLVGPTATGVVVAVVAVVLVVRAVRKHRRGTQVTETEPQTEPQTVIGG